MTMVVESQLSVPSDSGASVGIAAAVPRCHTTALRLSVVADEGAAGTGYLTLGLRNLGPTCRVFGFPGVAFYDARGRRITKRAVRSRAVPRDRSLRTVTLARGAF